MRRSTPTVRRACAVGATTALVLLTTGLGLVTATAAHAEGAADTQPTASVSAGATASDPPSPGAAGDTTPGAPTPTPTEEPSTPSDPSTPADGTGPTDTPTDAPTDSPSGTPTDTPTDAPTGAPGSADTAAPTATRTPDAPGTQAAVATPEVTLSGEAKVGSLLTATQTGFDEEQADVTWKWTDARTGAELSTEQFYRLQPTDAGSVIVVTAEGVTSDGKAAKATARTAKAVTQDPVFVDGSGKPVTGGTDPDTDALPLETTAGEPFSYTFRAQGFPAPTYALTWAWGDESDFEDIVTTKAEDESDDGWGFGFEDADVNGDGEFTADDQLPAGITFDPSTGELSGTARVASWYDFAVTATSGDVSTTQYVELTVDPGAAYGLAAVALDADLATSEKGAVYVIRPDGTIVGIDFSSDDDWPDFDDTLDHVSVRQGGTLLVYGTPVDRFGNAIEPTEDDDEWNLPATTVTSDVASDVIAPYREDGDLVPGVTSVTFPHASTHTLTVSSDALQPISFAVQVQPVTAPATVVPPTVVTPTVPVAGTAPVRGGRLAYTGTEATDALPWALGLVLAGAGVLGARALRRRSARR